MVKMIANLTFNIFEKIWMRCNKVFIAENLESYESYDNYCNSTSF